EEHALRGRGREAACGVAQYRPLLPVAEPGQPRQVLADGVDHADGGDAHAFCSTWSAWRMGSPLSLASSTMTPASSMVTRGASSGSTATSATGAGSGVWYSDRSCVWRNTAMCTSCAWLACCCSQPAWPSRNLRTVMIVAMTPTLPTTARPTAVS